MSLTIFTTFLRLGLTSFGGPIAHLGYFREAFVVRRRWLTEAEFAQLLAICQALPGPASSQLGFAVGLLKGGWRGGLLAFLGFTLPSALLMFGLALLAPRLDGGLVAAGLHGLKLVAVVVVAHGLVGMARSLVPDAPRALLAALALAVMLAGGPAWRQLAVIAGGGLLGLWLCRGVPALPTAGLDVRHGRGAAWALLGLFLSGLLGALLLASGTASLASLAAAFYEAGALVFGGGHVVLPLLEQSMVGSGWLGDDAFLAGYGAAQAMPGPMFALSAYLGALVPTGASPALGATIALLAMFLPGLVLVAAMLPLWRSLAGRRWAPPAIAGINAAVVGLLAAALLGTVLPAGVRGPADAVIALAGLALMLWARVNVLWVVGAVVAASVGVAQLT
ncbi:MAG TPA: chromate efflux transporter [Arenimonas sp.]|uniref:chromate efflux transporter n=1 Tax=Arenimonas sp. TaxID=1872635 RepID=UPI002D7EFF18|nr:chromate efflux transporter [Arenimonas sp.]HEU0153345.1 chromate efflux transporter [Arenimonas sp.]